MALYLIPIKLALALCLSLFHQEQPPQTGTYKILVDDAQVGTERYEVTKTPAGYAVRSTTDFTADGVARKIVTTSEIANRRLSRYLVETTTRGRTQKYTVDFTGGRAKAVIESGGRQTERVVGVSEDILPLDRNVWHHYGLLLASYDLQARGKQQFRVFIPQAGLREFTAEVELKGKTSVKIGEEKKPGYRFVIDLADGFEVVAFTDEYKNMLLLEVPAQKTKVIAE